MKSVWVIDDDQSILEVLQMLLQEDYEVTVIQKAEEVATKLVKKDPPDVALVDINLSGIDGKKIVHDIKSNEKCVDTKVILMTADIHIEEKAKEAKADGFLRKPFDITDLLKKIKRYTKEL